MGCRRLNSSFVPVTGEDSPSGTHTALSRTRPGSGSLILPDNCHLTDRSTLIPPVSSFRSPLPPHFLSFSCEILSIRSISDSKCDGRDADEFSTRKRDRVRSSGIVGIRTRSVRSGLTAKVRSVRIRSHREGAALALIKAHFALSFSHQGPFRALVRPGL